VISSVVVHECQRGISRRHEGAGLDLGVGGIGDIGYQLDIFLQQRSGVAGDAVERPRRTQNSTGGPQVGQSLYLPSRWMDSGE
jgi:hypothetical protein